VHEELATQLGRTFEPGDFLFRAGENADSVFVIRSGTVQVLANVDESPTVLTELGEGQFVGEAALIANSPRTTSAVAATRTCCLQLDPETFEELVLADPEISVRLLRGLAEQANRLGPLLQRLAHRDSRTRVVMALIQHAEASTERTAEGVWIRNKQMQDIGTDAAVPATELGEIAKQLLRKGLLRVQRGALLVPDAQHLYDYVNSTEA